MQEEEEAGAQDPRVSVVLSLFGSAVTFEQRQAASAPAAPRPDEPDEQAAARDAVFQFASGILGCKPSRGLQALQKACRKGGDKCVRCSLEQDMPRTLEQSGLTIPHSVGCQSAPRRASAQVELDTWSGDSGRPCAPWRFGVCTACGLQPSNGTLAREGGPGARLCNPCLNARRRAEDPHQWAIARVQWNAQQRARLARDRQQQPPGVGDRAQRLDQNWSERQWLQWVGPRQDCTETKKGEEIFESLRTQFEYDAPASHEALMKLARGDQLIPDCHQTHYALDIQTGADGALAALWRNVDFCPAYLRGASRERSDLTSILYSVLLTVVSNKDKVSLFVFGEMLPHKHGARTGHVAFVGMELARCLQWPVLHLCNTVTKAILTTLTCQCGAQVALVLNANSTSSQRCVRREVSISSTSTAWVTTNQLSF